MLACLFESFCHPWSSDIPSWTASTQGKATHSHNQTGNSMRSHPVLECMAEEQDTLVL